MSNLNVAKDLAAFADILAQYDHLPALKSVHLFTDQSAFIRPVDNGSDRFEQARDVCLWADQFTVPVSVQGTSVGVDVTAEFALGHFKARLMTNLYSDAELLAQALHWDAPPADGQNVELTAPQLLSALDRIAESAEQRRWDARKAWFAQQSREHGARDEDAEAWAERKTQEEMGPRPARTVVEEIERVSEANAAEDIGVDGGP